jgi:SAM-dependent methyltransferase
MVGGEEVTEAPLLCETGKDGYDWRASFIERTADALQEAETDHAPLTPLADLKRNKRLWAKDALMNDATWYMLQRMADWLMPLRDFRVLDIGCGYGRHAPFFSLFDCAAYVGIDMTPARIAYAKERYGGARISFEVADARYYYTDEKFDVVWCCTVIQHLPTSAKRQVVETIKAALAPGGLGLLLEGRVLKTGSAEEHYRSDKCALHMIPVEESVLREWALPYELLRTGRWFCMRLPE